MPILLENAVDKNVKIFDLTSATKVAQDNGAISGTVSFSRDGIELNGTDAYVTYATPNTLFGSAKISLAIEFTPDFNYNEDSAIYIYDTTSTDRYFVRKLDNGNGNVLSFYMGNTNLGSISSATYSAYWKVNERNVLVISGDSGDNNVWLNGTQIMTNNAVVWSPKHPINFYMGANNAGTSKFDGEIHSVSIKNDLTTAQEALDLTNNSTFNFQNKSDVWLDMKSQVGKASGTELVVGGMTYTGWTGANNPTLTNPSPSVLRVAYIDATNPQANQSILTSGKRYRIIGEARGDGVAVPRVLDGVASLNWIGTNSTSYQKFDFIGTSGHSVFTLRSNIASSGHCEFKNVTVEEVLQYTTDKSGLGNDFLLGDGSDTADYPDFSNPGFDFSADYMLNLSATSILNNAEQSMVFCFKPDFAANDGSQHILLDTSATNRYLVYKASSNQINVNFGGTGIFAVTLATYKPYWNIHGTNVLVISATTGASELYLNGHKIASDVSAWSEAAQASIILGATYGLAKDWDGEIFHFSAYAQKLTPTQMRQITSQLFNQYS